MRFKEISESTTSGSIAPTEHAFVKMQTRNPSVYGDQKVGSLFKGKKTSKPFVNSLNEGAMKQLSMDLKELKDEEFKKKYNKTKQEARTALKAKPEPVNEADLQEDDIIVVPGQGRLRKTGFTKNDPDKAEHEGQTLKNSLHTIIRVASHLDKELSTRDNFPEWVSEKIGSVKSNMVAVMDYLISAKEMQHDPDAMEEGSMGVSVSQPPGSTVSAGQRFYKPRHVPNQDELQKQGMGEGAKVDRMVKHVEKSEKKLGHSKKEAENIAWATANKRGMLDNKNKKAK